MVGNNSECRSEANRELEEDQLTLDSLGRFREFNQNRYNHNSSLSHDPAVEGQKSGCFSNHRSASPVVKPNAISSFRALSRS